MFGIALTNEAESELMGLGIPDQTIIWDAAPSNSTTQAMLENQSAARPLRTQDLVNAFDNVIALESIDSYRSGKSKQDFVRSGIVPWQSLW